MSLATPSYCAKFGAGVGTVAAFASATAKTSAAIDTLGFTHATAFFSFGDVAAVATATVTIKVQECATIGGSYSDITGATTAAIDVSGASTYDYATFIIPINLQNSARLRYLKLVITPNATLADIGAAGGGIVLTNGEDFVQTSTTSGAYVVRVAQV